MKLYYNLDIAAPVTKAGSTGGIKPPEIGYRDYCTAELTVYRFDDAGRIAPADLSGILSWTGAVDNDRKSATDVMVRMLPQDFDNSDASNGVIRFRFSCYTQPYFAKTDGIDDGIMAMLELYGLAEGGLQAVRITVPVRALPLVDPDGGEKPPVPDGYATQAWVLALLNSGMALQYSTDGETWLAVPPEHPVIPDAARWYRFRINGTDTVWSAAVPIPQGAPGDSPVANPATEGTILSADWGSCIALDSQSPVMTLAWADWESTRARWLVVSATSGIEGNAVIIPVVNGLEQPPVVIAVTSQPTEVEFDFAGPVLKSLSFRRDYENPLDTLRDGSPVALLVINHKYLALGG